MKILLYIPSLLVALTATAQVTPATAAEPGPITVAARRITESQYRHTIRDVFGSDIQINARFEPEQREAGLLAVGSALLSLTASGFEQYFVLATAIAEQVLADDARSRSMPCEPVNPDAMDPDCATRFLSQYGELLFRRPLTTAELQARLATVAAGVNQADFYRGLQLALTSMLVAPEFLFRMETAEPDPANPGGWRLDGFTRASRLSFLFWDSSPDRELLDAAARGELYDSAGLQRQVARLSDSRHIEEGATAFFVDMMQIDGFENLVKDPAIYPKFNQLVADSARQQMIMTIIDLLVHKNRDYRELFTSNETFINRPLAAVYRVPFVSSEEWAPYTFSDESERAGIQTQVGFLSLWAHPGTSSPTRRGIKIHEIFMCEPTPDPPADVDFSAVQAMSTGTTRDRLINHMENAGCNSCHGRSDPAGLSLEHFDGLGQLRTLENGLLIDVSADLMDGTHFVGASGLGRYLADDPRVPACLVRNVYSYATARQPQYSDQEYLGQQVSNFANNDYRVPDLFRQLALTDKFFEVVFPEGVQPNMATASSQD